MLRSFKELKVWQKSFALCKRIYAISRSFPDDERFGLASQLRRAAVSVPSNVAEGYNRATRRDYVRFLWIARGSLAEIETQLLLTKSLEYGPGSQIDAALRDIDEVERMLRSLIKSLRTKDAGDA